MNIDVRILKITSVSLMFSLTFKNKSMLFTVNKLKKEKIYIISSINTIKHFTESTNDS